MKTKRCSKCGEIKSESEFNMNRTKNNGLDSWCRKCSNKYGIKYYKKNPERAKKYYRKNLYRIWAIATINHHKKRDFDVIIIIDELEELAKNTIYCPLCDIKLKWEKGKKQDNSPTLDRINNEKILTLDNIKIICSKCNTTKSNRTMNEFIKYCTKISNKFNQI